VSSPQKVLTLSWEVDECKILMTGCLACAYWLIAHADAEAGANTRPLRTSR
jgi:hypothetical protein